MVCGKLGLPNAMSNCELESATKHFTHALTSDTCEARRTGLLCE
jgi:hypothetical protein